MPKPNLIQIDGRDYVLVPRDEYERLTKLAKVGEMPSLPKADAAGNYPAVEYLRASIARNIVGDRVRAGLSQRELARVAGVCVETLCRIETGKHTASTATIDKLDRALTRATKDRAARDRAPRVVKRRRNAS
jgi:ribosome-binding protein aMBF1 (putative translation factor)